MRRGEVWWADLDPTRGGEQRGRRPVLVVSADALQRAGRLAIIVPCTRTDRGFASHVRIEPPEGGLRIPTHVMCEQVRVLAIERFERRAGEVSKRTMTEVSQRLAYLLEL